MERVNLRGQQLNGVAAFPYFLMGYGQKSIKIADAIATPWFLQETDILESKATFKTQYLTMCILVALFPIFAMK